MPFGAIERPSLALGLLGAHCERLGVACDTRYLNITFAECIGLEDYLWVTDTSPYTAFAGDWIFREALYGPDPESDHRYEQEVFTQEWKFPDEDLSRVRRARAWAAPYIESLVGTIPWDRYTLVGFTSIFQQNIASLALARRIREVAPDVTIAFGGANWEDEMGVALMESFDFVDLAFSGKADVSFPALLQARADGRGVAGIAGVSSRDEQGAVVGHPVASSVEDLDGLPLPDFDPYFDQVTASSTTNVITPTLLVETARGCWWGERNHCTFCGLNGGTMAFKAKSPDRAVDEIVALHRRHPAPFFSVVDDILDMRYFRTALPRLAEEGLETRFFWEVKANLTHKQVSLLHDAGVTMIQPGVESLSDHVLDLMRKGTTGLRNVQLLKWCSELGVEARWNLLYGFPGETPEDYELTRRLIQAIWHLNPPTGCGPIRLDRFSPYHADPAAFAMVNVRPMLPFVELYPFDPDRQRRISYYFDFDYGDGRRDDAHVGDIPPLVDAWQKDDQRGMLWATRTEAGELALIDTRRGRTTAPVTARLKGWKAAVYDACDHARTLDELGELPEVEAAGAGPDDISGFLDRCRSHDLAIEQAGKWLAVAVYAPPRVETRARPHRLLSLVGS
jgi:ribosomal peptide maturation radical SAM protein 1